MNKSKPCQFISKFSLLISGATLPSSHNSIYLLPTTAWEKLTSQEVAHSHLNTLNLLSSSRTFLTRRIWIDVAPTLPASRSLSLALNLSLHCQLNLPPTWRRDTPSSNENKSLLFSPGFPFLPSFSPSLHSLLPSVPLLPAFWFCSHLTHATN